MYLYALRYSMLARQFNAVLLESNKTRKTFMNLHV